MSTIISKRLKLARSSMDYTQAELARLADVPQSTIARIESGDADTTKSIFKLAEALRINPLWLAGEMGEDNLIIDSESPLHKDSISITRIGRVIVRGIVEASNWAEACEWSEDQQYQVSIPGLEGQEIPFKVEHLFGLEVRGESMNVEYKPGWILVCIPTYDDPYQLEDGDNVIVRRESSRGCEVTVKKLKINKETGKYELHFNSYNPDYRGILPLFNLKVPYTADDVTISVVARVVLPIPTWATKPNQRKTS